MTDLEVDDFLAHFGVKGMRWGHRQAEDDGAPRASRLTEDQKRRLKTAAKVAGTAAVIVGIAATAYILHKNGKLPTFQIPKPKIEKPNLDKFKTVQLNTLKPKVIDTKKGGHTLVEKVQVGVEVVNTIKSGLKEKPAPKLDPDLQKFMNDSARRQAEDDARFKSDARQSLNEIEQDPFIYNFIRGSNPEVLNRLRRDSR